MTLTTMVLSFAWSLTAALVVALLIQVLAGKKAPALLVLGLGTPLILGLDLIFGVTDGVSFVMSSALMAIVNQSTTVFSIGLILAAVGILSMSIAALWSIVTDQIGE